MTNEGAIAADAASDTERLRAEVAELRARLDSYERILQLRDAALPATATPASAETTALPTTHDIAADQLLPAQDGFYQLEWGPDGALRWTGPDHDVHFEAWIDRSAPLIATFRLFHFGTPDNAKALAIEVDGQRYPLHHQGPGKVMRSEPIAPRDTDGPTRVTLHVPHIHSPSDHGAADRRRLGVAFQTLRLARD
ncbi:hypothetical protein GXW78_09685 [Roseomonas terrae]|uniref:Uncharacterized protein n=1 Tax=Neoroseomonas terrae TaxID=424799 RepID=A0ABS5EFY3_9PROT|nr:hypothetical protein [Neoroseomonas terrae]MBR0649934.1 hypothetical protein [Neoroseomonas terrae]